MKKIRSLIYRDLVISKKHYISSLLSATAVSVFGWLILMSMEFGNLADLSEEIGIEIFEGTKKTIYCIFNYLLAFIWSTFISDNGTAFSDIKSKWQIYGYTLPVTEKEIALTKLILKVSGIIISFTASIANGLLLSVITGIKFNYRSSAKIYLLIMLYFILSDFFTTAYLSWARTEKEANLVIIPQILIPILLTAISFLYIKNSEKLFPYFAAATNKNAPDIASLRELGKLLLERFGAFILPCIMVFTAAGYFVNAHLLKRRYK